MKFYLWFVHHKNDMVLLVLVCFAFFCNEILVSTGQKPPSFAKPIGNVTVVMGREAVLTCVVDNLGHYMVAWAHLNRKMVLTLHKFTVTRIARFAVSNDDARTWRLHIHDARKEDDGEYMCQLNTDPTLIQKGFLTVVVPPAIDDELSSNSVLTIDEFQAAVVRCIAHGIPAPNISWMREDGNDFSTGLFGSRETLTLARVQRSDMGAYLCVANNGVAPAVSKRFSVQVRFPPEVHLPKRHLKVLYGSDVIIDCIIECFPPGANAWLLNGSLIQHDEKVLVSEFSHSYKTRLVIEIKEITFAMVGIYTCSSFNSLGNARKFVNVRKSYLIPHFAPGQFTSTVIRKYAATSHSEANSTDGLPTTAYHRISFLAIIFLPVKCIP